MSRYTPRRIGQALLAVLGVLVCIVLPTSILADQRADAKPVRAGDRVVEAYLPDTTTTAYRSTVDDTGRVDFSNDNTGDNTTGIATVATESVANAPTISVSGRFSTASATATVHLIRGLYTGSITDTGSGTWTTTGFSTVTLTADGSIVDANGDYVSPTLYFDSGGATVFKIIAIPSAGNVDLWVRTY